MKSRCQEWLDAGSPFARRLESFEPRAEQLALAAAVESALRDRRHLLAEAGTGVGKSFAYLLPAVLHACEPGANGPIVVSTRTITLQQQLETKDLPFLHAVLPLEWSSVTAVGRNNYLCLRRMDLAQREHALFRDAVAEAELQRVVHWSLATRDGLRMELDPPVAAPVWEEVQAEHGNCLHRACRHYEPCHYQRSRRRLQSAQILIVNHALYMADVALRAAGASYLPAHRVVIFDEAHHLERVATESLGLRLTEGTLLWHMRRLQPRDSQRGLLREHGSPAARRLVAELRDASGPFFAELDQRLSGREATALEDAQLDDLLSPQLNALGTELAACAASIEALDLRMEMQARSDGVVALASVVRTLCNSQDRGNVRWIERHKRGPVLRSAPLEVADTLRRLVFTDRTAILVSATLDAGREADFGWLRRQLGIDDATTLRLGSPFDYARQVEVVVEEALPDPASEPATFLRDAKSRILDHLLANGGRALVLCTSWSFVRSVADFVAPALADHGIRLLVQGDAPIARLLADKKNEETSVLLGTDSLWEGIDVPGDALTLVIVARLPFAPPDHPLTKARTRALQQRGGHPFFDQSLPDAVLRFRQGFGRLVRRSTDRGKVVILDPRVRTKEYGRAFLAALPTGTLVNGSENQS